MLAPAFGNPGGNTLREFHYQSRCMSMVERREANPAVLQRSQRGLVRRASGAGGSGIGASWVASRTVGFEPLDQVFV